MKRMLYLLLVLYCLPAAAQQQISGFVRSRNQKPIAGAKVIETTSGAVFYTDQNGKFSGNLSMKTLNVFLEISAYGYITLSKSFQTNAAGLITETVFLGREKALYLIFTDERGRPIPVDTFRIPGVNISFRTDKYGNAEVPFDMTDGCDHGISIRYWAEGFITGYATVMVPCDGTPVRIRLSRIPPDQHVLDMLDGFQNAFSKFSKTPYYKQVVDEDVLDLSSELLDKWEAIDQFDKTGVSPKVQETYLRLFGSLQTPYRQLIQLLETDPDLALGWTAQRQRDDLDRQIEHFKYEITNDKGKVSPTELPDWADKRVEELRILYVRSSLLCKNYPGLNCSALHNDIQQNLEEIAKLLEDPKLKDWPELSTRIAESIQNTQDRINTLKTD